METNWKEIKDQIENQRLGKFSIHISEQPWDQPWYLPWTQVHGQVLVQVRSLLWDEIEENEKAPEGAED